MNADTRKVMVTDKESVEIGTITDVMENVIHVYLNGVLIGNVHFHRNGDGPKYAATSYATYGAFLGYHYSTDGAIGAVVRVGLGFGMGA